MAITHSEVVNQIPQIDGRIDVTERHVYESGAIQEFNYLADPLLDFQAIANQRAANINAEIARKEQELLIAANFVPPITVRAFLDKFTEQEQIDLRALAKSNAKLENAMAYLLAGPEVFKNVAQAWLQGLVPTVFTQARVDALIGNW